MLFDNRIETGFPRGSIGGLSVQLGQDVRELIIGDYSLDDVYKMLAEKEKKLEEKIDEGSD
ncbi:hypothetical protein [Candidatus Leptofilum sp.]|uniref:hypothetical protein n=1 Tax=Candidatus Leptofilum sp. TaxID=3241576 RepID=UPI003B590793